MTNGRRTLGLAVAAGLMLAGLAVPTVADPWNLEELRAHIRARFHEVYSRVCSPLEGRPDTYSAIWQNE